MIWNNWKRRSMVVGWGLVFPTMAVIFPVTGEAQKLEIRESRVMIEGSTGYEATVLGIGRLKLYDAGADLAVDLYTGSSNGVQIGSADPSGTNEANIDLRIVDPYSTLDFADTSFYFDASLADLTIGSGSSGEPGDDGDLKLEDGTGHTVFSIDGATANIFQDYDHEVTAGGDPWKTGNGALKGWAKVNSSGTLYTCWNCSASTPSTRLGDGVYRVRFGFGTIALRPVLAMVACHSAVVGNPPGQCAPADRMIDVAPLNGETNAVYVNLTDADGNNADGAFTVFVF